MSTVCSILGLLAPSSGYAPELISMEKISRLFRTSKKPGINIVKPGRLEQTSIPSTAVDIIHQASRLSGNCDLN
jgi:hypothetical protein